MPLDHYVSQVLLKIFCSPILGDRMYAIRKSDLNTFTPNSKVVCGINDGSTNTYLRKDRAIEEFLETIEPNYNGALDKLIAGNIDATCIYTIAGFIAYVVTCSPAGMRIQSGPLKGTLEIESAMMDAQGLMPPAPAALGGASLTELLQSGAVEWTIDPKYPQAIGISSILQLTAMFGNFKWEVLHNENDGSPFFTSDPRVLNRIVPLAPKLALRIMPDITLDKDRSDFSFANFEPRTRTIDHAELVTLNCLIVRLAEETVFYRDNHPWVQPFIAKNRNNRIEPHTHNLTTSTGTLQISTQRVVASTP